MNAPARILAPSIGRDSFLVITRYADGSETVAAALSRAGAERLHGERLALIGIEDRRGRRRVDVDLCLAESRT